jgi:glycosyltransferase involved in cell wall biosynthesis
LGHLTYSKGFYDLIFAYKMLYKKYGNNVSLIFAGENYGDDPRMDLLNEKWRSEFLVNGRKKARVCSDFIINCKEYNSIYPGIVSGEEKSKLFCKSDIFVLPSYSEGLSMGCLEAMAFGLPVITTPVGAMPEVIKDGENGVITPIGNHEKLAENIELLINKKELRIKMGNNNLQTVEEKYDIEKIARKLLFILDSI